MKVDEYKIINVSVEFEINGVKKRATVPQCKATEDLFNEAFGLMIMMEESKFEIIEEFGTRSHNETNPSKGIVIGFKDGLPIYEGDKVEE